MPRRVSSGLSAVLVALSLPAGAVAKKPTPYRRMVSIQVNAGSIGSGTVFRPSEETSTLIRFVSGECEVPIGARVRLMLETTVPPQFGPPINQYWVAATPLGANTSQNAEIHVIAQPVHISVESEEQLLIAIFPTATQTNPIRCSLTLSGEQTKDKSKDSPAN